MKMLKVLHEDGGSEIIDEIHGLVVCKLRSSSNRQVEISISNEVAFEETWIRLMAVSRDDKMLDAVTELSTSHAKNIKCLTLLGFPALELLISNWTIIYFTAVAIKQSRPSTSILSQYACTLLGLTNTSSGPAGTKVCKEKPSASFVCRGSVCASLWEGLFCGAR